jgi:ParB/RepB/Spo0J family partition protein
MSTTTFEPALDVKNIKAHPANPRHTVRADAEMVDSIRSQGLIQPLVVAPATDGTGYVVIAGHRRLDGLKKAKKKTAPAIVRDDLTTDAQQIEAAVVENVHRLDLTPIEEAEAFAQLRDLKWTQTKIATRTGRPIATVRDRLKLLTLSTKTQSSVHKGQLTIGDALAIASFDDDAQARLSKAAGKPDFRYQLQHEKDRRANAQKLADLVAKFDGVDETVLKDGETRWTHQSRLLATLYAHTSHDVQKIVADLRKDHQDCLGYIVEPSTYGAGCVTIRCATPDAHDEDFSDEDAAAQREHERRHQAEEAERQAKAAARQVRLDTVMDLVGPGTRLDARFVDITRVLLPNLLASLHGEEFEPYAAALGIWQEEGEDWWKALYYGPIYKSTPKKIRRPFDDHLAEIPTVAGGELARRLVAAMIALCENRALSKVADAQASAYGDQLTAQYFTLLDALGFNNSEVDTEIRANLPADEAMEAAS